MVGRERRGGRNAASGASRIVHTGQPRETNASSINRSCVVLLTAEFRPKQRSRRVVLEALQLEKRATSGSTSTPRTRSVRSLVSRRHHGGTLWVCALFVGLYRGPVDGVPLVVVPLEPHGLCRQPDVGVRRLFEQRPRRDEVGVALKATRTLDTESQKPPSTMSTPSIRTSPMDKQAFKRPPNQ